MAMTSEQFRQRRLDLGLTQTQLAEALGKGLRIVQYYESSEVEIPKHVELLLGTLRPKRKRKAEVTTDAV